MKELLLSPPIAFVLVLAFLLLASFALTRVAFRRKGSEGALRKAYTGGERLERNRVQPDYAQFFPFAFFFTILHVVTLTVATVPLVNPGSFAIALIYILGTLLGLVVLFRR